MTEVKTFTKTLRQIVPVKKGTDFDSALDSHPAPSEREASKKFTKSLSDVITVKGQNGEPDSYATTSPSKKPGPNAGKTAPMAKISEAKDSDYESLPDKSGHWHKDPDTNRMVHVRTSDAGIHAKAVGKDGHEVHVLHKHGEAEGVVTHKTWQMGRKKTDLLKGLAHTAKKVARGYHKKHFLSEEVEQIDELSKDTLKSYYKKAGKSAEKHYDKASREEDRAMSTDGNKYPEKQARHNALAQGHIRKYRNRVQGAANAHARLQKEDVEQIDELMGKGKLADVHGNLQADAADAWRRASKGLNGGAVRTKYDAIAKKRDRAGALLKRLRKE